MVSNKTNRTLKQIGNLITETKFNLHLQKHSLDLISTIVIYHQANIASFLQILHDT